MLSLTDPKFIQISFNKIQKIIKEEAIKLKCYDFSDCFKSLTLAKIVKKTKRNGEPKSVIFGIAN